MKITRKSFIIKSFIMFIALYIVFGNISTLNASPNVSASSAIVVDVNTGFILHEKNIHEPRYPASLAKIMTALIALEQYGTRLDERIIFSRDAVYSIPAGSSHIAMNAGETLTIEDALYGLLVSSANEVAGAIAEHIGGDINGFAALMTRRASALGAVNTNFTNPSGLHCPYQVTTAYDMAIITREALRHPKFREIISTVRHDIPPTEYQPLVRELLNSNRFIRSGQHFNELVLGGKTGFTNEAQHTLATHAQRGERELIAVTLHGQGSQLYSDTSMLLNYAFNIPYERKRLFERGEHVKTVPVYSGLDRHRVILGDAVLAVPNDVYIELPYGFDISDVEINLYTPPMLVAPIQSGQNIGRAVYSVRGITMGDILLRAASTVLVESDESEDGSDGSEGSEESEDEENARVAGTYSNHYPDHYTTFSLDYLIDNYYLTVLLPIAIFFAGLIMSAGILRSHRNKRQAKGNRYNRYLS